MAGNTFGEIFRITTFGESHGPAIGAIVKGCPPGLELSEKDIQKELERRKTGQSRVTTTRKEPDKVRILSGVFEGKTTGTPIALLIENKDVDSKKYEKLKNIFRPGHADFTYFKKFGIRDHRGGGRASARETATRVAAGAIAKKILKKQKTRIIGHTIQIFNMKAEKFVESEIEKNQVRCADRAAAKKMIEAIHKAKREGDSLGGIIEIKVINPPIGLGEPVFDKLDATISQAIMSMPAVKGVEIGLGFNSVNFTGKQHNDEIFFDKRTGKTLFKSNNAGGILGGISNGDEIIVRFVVKPPSSIAKKQETINTKGKKTMIEVLGRHDPCVAPRAIPIAEAMIALVLVDFMMKQKAREII